MNSAINTPGSPDYIIAADKQMLIVFRKYTDDEDLPLIGPIHKVMYLLDPTQKASNREIYKPEAICLFGLLYPNHSFDLDIDSPVPIPTPKPKPVTYDSSGEDDDEVALANFSPKSVDDWIALFLREEKVPALNISISVHGGVQRKINILLFMNCFLIFPLLKQPLVIVNVLPPLGREF